MPRPWSLLPFAAVVWLLSVAGAAAGPDVGVSFDGKRLQFWVDAVVDAPAEAVRAVLEDYDRLDRVFPLVAQSRRLPPVQEDVQRVFTLMRGCVLFVCRELEHTIDIRELPGGWSTGITVPELSRVKRGDFAWRVDPDPGQPGGSRMQMYGDFEPDFRVPRILGVPLVRAWARSELHENVGRIERAALDRAREAAAAPVPASPW
jgi:hypothetical protein